MEYSITIKLLVFLKEAVMENVINKNGKESRGNLGCLVNLLCCILQAIVSHSVFLQTLDLRGGNVCSLVKGSSMVKRVWEILVQGTIILQVVECKQYFSMAKGMPRVSETLDKL